MFKTLIRSRKKCFILYFCLDTLADIPNVLSQCQSRLQKGLHTYAKTLGFLK